MPRAHRMYSRGLVWHITHRCHHRAFLLKFARDRRRWRHWLFEGKRRYGLCVLNYIVTSNHIHLMVADQGRGEIAAAMQLIEGKTAQEYNRRKNRQGAFWEDRYHATAVQTGHHLIRCLSYVDLNMVRAGVVGHPKEWRDSGFHEIRNALPRKGVVDHARLCALVGVSSLEQLQAAHGRWIDEALREPRRDPAWTESVAVGDEHFLGTLKIRLGAAGLYRQVSRAGGLTCLMDARGPYSSVFGPESCD
jgi:putative transposase